MSQENNLVLFPNVQEKLMKDSMQALNDKNYVLALESIDELLKFGINSYEINVGKIISSINLKQFDEALLFCETILEEATEYYIEYFDYFLMILYEKGLFIEVMEEITNVTGRMTLPLEYEEKFSMMYELANQMNEEGNKLIYSKFQRAVIDSNHSLQWHYLHQLKDRKAQASDMFLHLLKEKSVHPVIKTFILSWFQSIGIVDTIEIEKFHQIQTIEIQSLPIWQEHPKYFAIKQTIQDIEQSNPTMYALMITLLDSYFTVNYPMIEKASVNTIATALIHVAKKHLALVTKEEESDDSLIECIELINLSHELYLSIVMN